MNLIATAAEAIGQAEAVIVFTGAGISVESGIPPFRGEGGIWEKYDPECLEISRFHENPANAWLVIKELFYDFLGGAKPNKAHYGIAEMEAMGLVGTIVTQNIDYLHQLAGSNAVVEFHGTYRRLICVGCHQTRMVDEINLQVLPPLCTICGEVMKPDFVFFGEPIPVDASFAAFGAAGMADVVLVVGTTGEVMPASLIPVLAKQENSATIIEVNTSPSNYTDGITDIYLEGRATDVIGKLVDHLRAGSAIDAGMPNQ